MFASLRLSAFTLCWAARAVIALQMAPKTMGGLTVTASRDSAGKWKSTQYLSMLCINMYWYATLRCTCIHSSLTQEMFVHHFVPLLHQTMVEMASFKRNTNLCEGKQKI